MLLTELSVQGLLQEMTEEEKNEYQKNPTGLNAAFLNFKPHSSTGTEYQPQTVRTFTITLGDKSKIICKATGIEGDEKLYFEIIQTTGPISKVNEEELKKMVKEFFDDFSKKLQNKFLSPEELNTFIKENNSNTKIDVDGIKIHIGDRLSQIQEQKQSLEQLREEVLSTQNDEQSLSNDVNNTKKRIKSQK